MRHCPAAAAERFAQNFASRRRRRLLRRAALQKVAVEGRCMAAAGHFKQSSSTDTQHIALLRVARDTYCRTGLATMSYRREALHVLRALDIEESLDVVLTREDVQKPKPDPEIYLLTARNLGVAPQDCRVLEDSPNGVRAGVAAGMGVAVGAGVDSSLAQPANAIIPSSRSPMNNPLVRDRFRFPRSLNIRDSDHRCLQFDYSPQVWPNSLRRTI